MLVVCALGVNVQTALDVKALPACNNGRKSHVLLLQSAKASHLNSV